MQVLENYQKAQALESILAHFDNDIESITREELFIFSRDMIVSLDLHNTNMTQQKVFTPTQVAVLFIYQELKDEKEVAPFDALLSTKKHKESIASLIHTAGEFAHAYSTLNSPESTRQINKLLLAEYRTLKRDVKDDKLMELIYNKLFDEKGSYTIKTHIFEIVQIYNHYKDHADMSKKIYEKQDLFTLMLLFQVYEEKHLLESYEAIKKMANINDTTIQQEIKYIVNDYEISKDSTFLETCNLFFKQLVAVIKNHYFMGVDATYIQKEYEKLESSIRVMKWYNRFLMKKDNWLFQKNTLKIQEELLNLEKNYPISDLSEKKFEGQFQIFSNVSFIIHEYDDHFQTIGRLSSLLDQDFSGYYEVVAMNIKNMYESSRDPIEIEAINRLIYFWMGINRLSLAKKRAIKV